MKRLSILLSAVSFSFAGWPLDSVLARADSCIQLLWTPTAVNTDQTWYSDNGALCTGSDSKYRSCDFIAGTSYRGIAYSYGGEDTPSEFVKRLGMGLAVGSHLCHYQTFGDPTPLVAGTDCSGFLCWAWNIPRTSTSNLVKNFPAVERSDIRTGDALVKAGNHCVLVAEAVNPKKAVIMESTSAVNSCRERVVDITDSYWSGYTPIRNPFLGEETSLSGGHERAETAFSIRGNTITLNELNVPFSLTVCSMNGTVLYQKSCAERTVSVTVPAEKWAAGIYLVRIRTAETESTAAFRVIP